MLFNSVEFILIYLPIVLVFFYIFLIKFKILIAIIFLVLSSLFFYGFSYPEHVSLLLASILFNYQLARLITKNVYKKFLLILGIFLNLSLLCYFKYSNFFIETFNSFVNDSFNSLSIILPIGISFFTFQQIAFLIDNYNKKSEEKNILHYTLFVSFFPQLISGPIVNHNEIKHQFKDLKNKLLEVWKNLSIGTVIITIGLFKKVILAEKMGVWSDQSFSFVQAGGVLTFLEAWIGILCFTFQIYFDFSAYSDIALGLGLLFGLKLPVNFLSPYKASSIIEFWRLWHITLSRFLKNYLYFPLGGSKVGKYRKYLNLILVMLLGGLWHGAGWTFILWGLFHGILLSINHFFRSFIVLFNLKSLFENYICLNFFKILTFLFVAIGWVLFRSADLNVALSFYSSLFGFNGFFLPNHYESYFESLSFVISLLSINFAPIQNYGGGYQILWILIMFCFVWIFPNSWQISQFISQNGRSYEKMKLTKLLFNFYKIKIIKKYIHYIFSMLISITLLFLVINIIQGKQGEFIYFQF